MPVPFKSIILIWCFIDVSQAFVSRECNISSQLKSEDLQVLLKAIVPALERDKRKGDAGKIGVIGGSIEYTGAPYFTAMTSLKVGADLVFVITTESAAPIIKSYSPELIVYPFLNKKNEKSIPTLLEKMDVVVIGPGLGRDNLIMAMTTEIILTCKDLNKPLIVDADGLYLISKNLTLIQNYPPPGVVLLPNRAEKERIEVTMNNSGIKGFAALGAHTSVLLKGRSDSFLSSVPNFGWSINDGGSGRRAGGQGDILAGALGTFFRWALHNTICENKLKNKLAASIATFGAAKLTRKCNEKAFKLHGRSMVASDMLSEIHSAFEEFLC